jgi:choline dehydrogenase-like flavoprotein
MDLPPLPANAPRFSPRERRILEALAERVMPPGPRYPATPAEMRFVDRMEAFFADEPLYAFEGYRAALWAIERGAILKKLRSFSRLSAEKQDAYLHSLQHSKNPLVRQGLKVFLSIMKIVRYSGEDVYEALRYRREPLRGPGQKLARGVFGESVRHGRALDRDLSVAADVVVIGTGAGGAVVGKELQERGQEVVFLEEGEYFTRVDFNRRPLEMTTLLYRENGMIAAFGRPGIVLPIGRTVGGTTTINSGTCFRVPDSVLQQWRSEMGLPFTSEIMAPYFEKVEKALHIQPVPRELWGRAAEMARRGCEKLGYEQHGPLSRNAHDCKGSGVCCFGCPTGAKQAMNVSYIPRAMELGATVYTGARAERLLVEGGRVQGVVARTAGGADLVVRAKKVVLACGSLLTPVLLERNGLGGRSGQLGRNLTIHPATKALALFGEEIRGWEAVPQGYQIAQFHEEGLLFEGASVPPEYGSLCFPFIGRRFSEVMEAYDRIALFGLMVSDTTRGRVVAGPTGKPVVLYNINARDTQLIVRGLCIMARIFLAAGAQAVFPDIARFDELVSMADVDRLERTKVSAWDLDLVAFHPLGTARMGVDPGSSVVSPEFELHEVRGLYVVDGSVFPTALGVNPQLTIMGFATYAAERIGQT